MEKEIEIFYPAGHSYCFEYELEDDLHCPNCGHKGIWIETDGGDFYQGPEHVCTKCSTRFCMPSMSDADGQVIEQLRGDK